LDPEYCSFNTKKADHRHADVIGAQRRSGSKYPARDGIHEWRNRQFRTCCFMEEIQKKDMAEASQVGKACGEFFMDDNLTFYIPCAGWLNRHVVKRGERGMNDADGFHDWAVC